MKKKLLWTAILLFITANILLVIFDKDGKVERKNYVSDWNTVYEANLFEKMDTPGVVSYTGEQYVYFDDGLGNFQGFLLEEGSEINIGDPMFSYAVDDYAHTESVMVNEIDALEGEIAAIEGAITEMVSYRIPEPALPVINSTDEDEHNIILSPREPVEAELLKKQYLIEKEKELASRKEQVDRIESQLEELRSSGETITVESPFQGKVKTISTTLDDPILVIEETDLLIKGELNEKERKQVKQGLSVAIMLDDTSVQYQGVIQEVSDSPSEDASLNSESQYPFEVRFNEEEDITSLLPGYHTSLTITLNEALQVPTLQGNMLFNDYIWKLTEAGSLEEVPVETGIQMGNQIEVKSGAVLGDYLLTEDKRSMYSGSTFFTPLKIKDVPWLLLGDYDSWQKNLVIGLISR